MPNGELYNLGLSVHYRLYSILRQQGWFYTEFGVEMEQPDADADPLLYHHPDFKRPFVFLDDNYAAWPSGVKVYDKGVPLPSGRYVVDYMNSTIRLTVSPSGAVTADLTMYTVNVREGYLEGEELEKANLPVIAWDTETDENMPFSIGPGPKWRTRYISIDIFASNRIEQKNLTESVGRGISKLPYLDFTDHAPLDEENKLDPAFDFADQWDGNLHMPDGIRGELLKPRQDGSEKERYRSLVTFTSERVS
jgi:hypothetical protein